MTKMTRKQIERREKTSAAIHEAGHLTVAIAEGRNGSAWLLKNDSGNDEEKSWHGKFHGPISPTVAVAGLVAEMLNDEPDIEPHVMLWYLDDETYIPSDTDKNHFPPAEELEGVIYIARDSLQEHKTFFDWAVAMLMEGEVITDGMAREQFEKLST